MDILDDMGVSKLSAKVLSNQPITWQKLNALRPADIFKII